MPEIFRSSSQQPEKMSSVESDCSDDEGDKKAAVMNTVGKMSSVAKHNQEKNTNNDEIAKRKRLRQHCRCRSKQKKANVDHNKSWAAYVKFMISNVVKRKNYQESPHIIIRRSLNLIYENSIILKNALVDDSGTHYRKIFL